MLWSCSTWSFKIATSRVTLETAFLCNGLINLGKSWKIKLFPNPVGGMVMRPLPRNTFWRQSFYSICKVSTFGKNRYSTIRDSMEDDLRTGTPYRISCPRQQPSGVDRRCQIWPTRGYTRFWYTVMSFLKLISQAFPRPLPQPPLFFSRSFARYILRSRSAIWTPGTGYILAGI